MMSKFLKLAIGYFALTLLVIIAVYIGLVVYDSTFPKVKIGSCLTPNSKFIENIPEIQLADEVFIYQLVLKVDAMPDEQTYYVSVLDAGEPLTEYSAIFLYRIILGQGIIQGTEIERFDIVSCKKYSKEKE